MRADVVVLGGGPAGIAVAVALARLGRSVVVLERSRYDRPRAGETFGGEVRPLLRALGADEEIAALSHVPFRGVQSAWGGASLVERTSLVHPFGEGWHVDRARFDALLARSATRAGVVVEQGTGACAIARDDAWRVRAARHEVTARFLVDASGRGAPATAAQIAGRQWLRVDRQVALVARRTATKPAEPVLVLEAAEDGWWYSVPQPDGALLVVFVTDADLLPVRGRVGLAEHFEARLARTAHTAERAAGSTLAAPPWVARSETGVLLPDRGAAWRALGDAAMGCDPLAGDGVARALRTALEAAPEIHAALDAAPDARAAAAATWQRFRDYLDLRAEHYAREPRWPNAPFWARRRALDWRSAPLFLAPERVLCWAGAPPARDAMAPVEALIPLGAARALLERLRAPAPAHEALAFLRALVPSDERRLLVALQVLASGEVLVTP